jgi:CheY-like chemotaxis protein
MFKKILLIDDDPHTNLYNSIILEEAQIVEEIVVFENIDMALNYIRQTATPPDMIILDLNMPPKTGWFFIDAYRTIDSKYHANKLFVLSTTISPLELRRVEMCDLVDAFYTKPLKIEFLMPGDNLKD